MIHSDKGCLVQERLLLPIPKVFKPRGSRLCHERSPRRDLREPLRVTVVGTQTDSSRILLAHNAERCPNLCQSLRQVSKVQQRHQTTVERINPNGNPGDICLVGIRHHGPISNSGTATEVPYSRHRLLHKVGRS